MDLSWNDRNGGTSGVHDHEGDLLWWHTPGGPNGRFGEAARSQTLADFRANGPAVTCPPWVEKELRMRYGPQA